MRELDFDAGVRRPRNGIRSQSACSRAYLLNMGTWMNAMSCPCETRLATLALVFLHVERHVC